MMPEFTTSWRHAEETFTAETDTKLVWDALYTFTGPSHSSSDVVWMNGWLSIRNARNARNFNPT